MIEKNYCNVFYRDDLFAATVEICPKNVGHFLIIPIRHVESIFELTDEEFIQLRRFTLNVMSNHFCVNNFIGRYKQFLSSAEKSDTRVIERCHHAIEFMKRESKLLPSGFSCGFNEGSNSGKEHEHLHMHVVPAYKKSANKRGIRGLF
jgi:diadenosine tetraphosphate (Ap4A) HIT family hydrolase